MYQLLCFFKCIVFILIALGCWDCPLLEIVSCYMYPGWNWTENWEKLTFGASQTACNWDIEGDFEGVPFAFYPALSVFVELTDHIWPWIPSSTVAVQDTIRWTGACFFPNVWIWGLVKQDPPGIQWLSIKMWVWSINLYGGVLFIFALLNIGCCCKALSSQLQQLWISLIWLWYMMVIAVKF